MMKWTRVLSAAALVGALAGCNSPKSTPVTVPAGGVDKPTMGQGLPKPPTPPPIRP